MSADQIQQTLDDAKCINSCIPPGMQMAVLIQLASQIQAGGTGTAGQPDFITVAGPPSFTPGTNDAHIVVDSNGRQWQYFGGTWN